MSILTKTAKELFEANVLNVKLHKQVGKKLLREWNIPLGITNDLLTLRKTASEVSDYILYHLICAIDEKILPKGYPPQHLKDLLNQKYSDEKIALPIKYKVIQIDDEHWIGKITARELFSLGNSMMINYNDKAQRVMRHIETENGEHWEIVHNEKAINGIENSFLTRRYIPNAITLNIPVDDTSDFYYDESTYELTIRKINMFDMTDGYHRYVAINRICSLYPDFDYPMELRITNFSIDTARQFIWQEDQKTHMSKVESASLNKYDAANMIVKKMQDSIYGTIIQYNKGIISSSVLSNAIRIVYDISLSKNYNISTINMYSKEIISGFDSISEEIPDIFDTNLSSIEVYCLIMMIKNKMYDKKNFVKMTKYAEEIIQSRAFSKALYKRVMNELKGGA